MKISTTLSFLNYYPDFPQEWQRKVKVIKQRKYNPAFLSKSIAQWKERSVIIAFLSGQSRGNQGNV